MAVLAVECLKHCLNALLQRLLCRIDLDIIQHSWTAAALLVLLSFTASASVRCVLPPTSQACQPSVEIAAVDDRSPATLRNHVCFKAHCAALHHRVGLFRVATQMQDQINPMKLDLTNSQSYGKTCFELVPPIYQYYEVT